MPRHDGTGPDGEGPRSGRKLGNPGDASKEEKLQKPGKGLGRGKGGRGMGKQNRSRNGSQ